MIVSGTLGDEDRSYLEPIRGETLSTALDRELADLQCLVRTPPRANPGYAAVHAGDRSAHVSLVLAERPFALTIWDSTRGFAQAHGWASELAQVAMAIQVFLEKGRAMRFLAKSFSFLDTKPFVENVDPDVTIEGCWQAMLLQSVPAIEERAAERPEHAFSYPGPEVAELIRRASERPELRCRQPFTSRWRFGLWQQFLNFNVPVAWATKDAYTLAHNLSGELYAKGSLSTVFEAWVEQIADWPGSRLDAHRPEP
jgi:hypothetical protein